MPTETSLKDCRMTGAAGEHYVLCQLLRNGFIAAQAPEGVAKMDVVASDQDGAHLFSIQVKTRNELGADGGWHMKKKHETSLASLFYCFVDLGTSPAAQISCFVIPGSKVAEVVSRSHMIWKTGTGMKGQPRAGDSEMRRLLPNYCTPSMTRPEISESDRAWLNAHGAGWLTPFKEAWHLLGNSENH